MHYSNKVSKCRGQLDLTYRELAKITASSHATVRRWRKSEAEPNELQKAILDGLCDYAEREDAEGKRALISLAERGDWDEYLNLLFCQRH